MVWRFQYILGRLKADEEVVIDHIKQRKPKLKECAERGRKN